MHLAQAPTFATVIAAIVGPTVRYDPRGASHCAENGIWAIGTQKASQNALVLFMQHRVQRTSKRLCQELGASPFGAAMQQISSCLVLDDKFAKNVASQVAQALLARGENSMQLDRNSAVLATASGQLYDASALFRAPGPAPAQHGDQSALFRAPGPAPAQQLVSTRIIQPQDLIHRTLRYDIAGDAAHAEAVGDIVRAALTDDDSMRNFWTHALATIAFAPPNTDRNVFVLVGETHSGKTTLIELLCALYGDYAVKLPESLLYGKEFDERSAVASLAGARLAYVDDPTQAISVELLKRLTNRDGDATLRSHVVIATQESSFRTVLSNAYASIGSRVSVITLPKRFVPPEEFSAENASEYPLAKTSSELQLLFRTAAPSLMFALLNGGELESCAHLYATSRTPLPRCEQVRINTQRHLEPSTISEAECVAKWKQQVMSRPAPDAQPLLIRQLNGNVDVQVLVADYIKFVAGRRRDGLAVPKTHRKAEAEVAQTEAEVAQAGDNDDEDFDPRQPDGAQADTNDGPKRRSSPRSTAGHPKKSKTSAKALPSKSTGNKKITSFMKALKAVLKADVVDNKVVGYHWTQPPQAQE